MNLLKTLQIIIVALILSYSTIASSNSFYKDISTESYNDQNFKHIKGLGLLGYNIRYNISQDNTCGLKLTIGFVKEYLINNFSIHESLDYREAAGVGITFYVYF